MNWDYITGFFDADGYITMVRPNKNKNKTLVVGFTNVELELLEEIKDFINESLNVRGTIVRKQARQETHSDSYDLTYKFSGALKVIDMIDTKHPKKKHRKNVVSESYLKLTPRNGKYTEEMKEKREKMVLTFFSP